MPWPTLSFLLLFVTLAALGSCLWGRVVSVPHAVLRVFSVIAVTNHPPTLLGGPLPSLHAPLDEAL